MAKAALFFASVLAVFAICLTIAGAPMYLHGRDVGMIVGLTEAFGLDCVPASLLGNYSYLEAQFIKLGEYHALTERGYVPTIDGEAQNIDWLDLTKIEQYCKAK